MSEQTKTAVKQGGMNTKVRYITVTAMLSAVAFVLMYLEIAIPIMPSFIKFDFSDLPALLGSFALGPVCGVLIYKHKKTKKSAVVSGLVAALVMGIVSVFSNYFVVYPVYYKAGMAEEAILQMYQAIAPSMKSVLQCLICFNLPFTIVKGLIAVVICMLIYKPLSPVLKGRLSEY